MPQIESTRKSKCSVCHQPIQIGELIDYSRAMGARHMTCSDQIPIRLNEYRSSCSVCGAWLNPGQGILTYEEHVSGDLYLSKWITVCVNSYDCNKRLAARPNEPEANDSSDDN